MAWRVVGIRTERTLITVPVVGPNGCVVSEPEDCCDGGSGSGSGGTECVSACDRCSTMSNRWTLSVTNYDPVILTRVENPNDGNECRFVSDDLTWDLYFDYCDELWLLVNYDTEELWFLSSDEWACLGENLLTYDGEGDSAQVTPELVCVTYNCVDFTCTPVAGDGGEYGTLAECEEACEATIVAGSEDCATAPELSEGVLYGLPFPEVISTNLMWHLTLANGAYHVTVLDGADGLFMGGGPQAAVDATNDCCVPLVPTNFASGNICYDFTVVDGGACIRVTSGDSTTPRTLYLRVESGACP